MGDSTLTEIYDEFFTQATRLRKPYDYQRRLALATMLPQTLRIPTGVGKTAAIILGWLFRRFLHSDSEVRKGTPRRLVYCLPMRTLVEQTEEAASKWLKNLAEQDVRFRDTGVPAHLLMGGAEDAGWDRHPEREAILIGTQDMLLSRALNRGYGMSRYRWPMHFSLLNNDCLWVLDETQLMGVGLTTSSQLQGLRDKLKTYGMAQSLWMSATLDAGRLSTVDHPLPDEGWSSHELTSEDRAEASVQSLIEAAKPCRKAEVRLTPDSDKKGYDTTLGEEIAASHRPGTLTLVVVNRVGRAQSVFLSLQKGLEKQGNDAEPFLIHSRFRKCDRDERQEEALRETTIAPDGPGRIVIATQAIEAGVDISATTLFTELSPWSSLVQRFGRCNRRGKCGAEGVPNAQVFWIDLDTSDGKKALTLALPYAPEKLDTAREHLSVLSDVGPQSLETIVHEEPLRIDQTLRRKDLLELWDTTPDLAGNDLDVSRYIREGDDTDVQVYWRQWDEKQDRGQPPTPSDDTGECVFAAPSREELCAVSIGNAKRFLEALRKRKAAKKSKVGEAWRWNPLDQTWEGVRGNEVRPGMVLLLHIDAGGYDTKLGWTGDATDNQFECLPVEKERAKPDGMDNDDLGSRPVLLTQHLRVVAVEARAIKEKLDGALEGVPWNSLLKAAEWHDVGKAHPAFQTAMHDSEQVKSEDPKQEKLWAKSGGEGFPRYRIPGDNGDEKSHDIPRRGFRHELASALVWLNHAEGEADADLIAFLIAAHHGKVRGSIRSMPNERQPEDPEAKFARGLWDGDEIPPVEVSGDSVTDRFEIDLSLMQLGEDENGKASWLARVLGLRDEYGPFRLAYLETLVRLADWRGSNEEGDSNG
ncbi:MAG: CRISPR-associated endonuclease Cas3'' [Planctomycetes bacterium]|nr:CRISPR-associated endonuclease Cas3'' [Planctomycetota bacterium]